MTRDNFFFRDSHNLYAPYSSHDLKKPWFLLGQALSWVQNSVKFRDLEPIVYISPLITGNELILVRIDPDPLSQETKPELRGIDLLSCGILSATGDKAYLTFLGIHHNYPHQPSPFQLQTKTCGGFVLFCAIGENLSLPCPDRSRPHLRRFDRRNVPGYNLSHTNRRMDVSLGVCFVLKAGARLSEPEVNMSAQFSTESEVVQRTQTISGARKGNFSSPDEVILLRLPGVRAVTGLSKSSLYALIRADSFPAPVQIGPRTVAWVGTEVQRWAAERVLASRSAISNQSSKLMPRPAFRETSAATKKWA
jgi:prophage regulatory protein